MTVKKLPEGLYDVLTEINKKYPIDKLIKSKSLKNILETTKKINDYLIEKNMSGSELNTAIKNHDTDNEQNILTKLQELTNHKNEMLYKKAYRSRPWLKCIKHLKQKYIDEYPNIRSKEIESAFIEVINAYKNEWDGYWSTLKLNNNKINKIILIDHDDIIKFNLIIKKNYKK